MRFSGTLLLLKLYIILRLIHKTNSLVFTVTHLVVTTVPKHIMVERPADEAGLVKCGQIGRKIIVLMRVVYMKDIIVIEVGGKCGSILWNDGRNASLQTEIGSCNRLWNRSMSILFL